MPDTIYNILVGLLSTSMHEIQKGMYQSASMIFDNAFFNAAMGIAIGWIGFMIAFKKFTSEEAAYKIIWALIMFSLVKIMLWNNTYYTYFIDIMNVPRDAFMQVIHDLVTKINPNATLETIITTLFSALQQTTSAIFSKGAWDNLMPYIYGFIVWMVGVFLLLTIILNSLLSLFLSDLVMALLPLVLPTLIWKKTEYVFVSWIKLYISVSLYMPFTMLFGIISIQVVNLTMKVATSIEKDFAANIEYLVVLVIAQLLIALGIFKIPNIVNQLIGSSNEGSSLTSGVGTLSAGGALISGAAKYTGMSFAAKHSASAAKKSGHYMYDKAMDRIKNKIKMR